MKKFKQIIAFVSLLVLLAGCTKDIKTYDGKDSIYFLYAVESRFVAGVATISDFTPVSMGFEAPEKTDTLIMVPVRTMGQLFSTDRPYVVKVGAKSTAVAGKHFEFVNNTFSIKAGQRNDTIRVLFKRTAEMKDTTIHLVLELQPNEHFALAMEDKVINTTTGEKRSYITHTISVNDILRKPARWLDAYFGTFTAKKLFLLCDLVNINAIHLDQSASVAEITFYGKFMQRYLNEMKAAGTPVYEVDGSEMVMGPQSQ